METVARRRRGLRLDGMRVAPYLFIAPAMVYLAVVTVTPVLLAFPISLSDWTALTPRKRFVGAENYLRLLTDREFLHSLLVTAQFLLGVPIVMAAGLVVALLLNHKMRGMTAFRVVYYSPVITSTIAAAVLFDWFFQPSFGLFNGILEAVGLPGIGWVSDARTAAMSVILFRVWKGTGGTMLIYLAGLQDVPAQLIEAAQIDGAGAWKRFRHVTLPLLKPATAYLLVTGIIGTFMIFQETYMLKGPLKSTDTVVNYIYQTGFLGSEMGYASAMSFALFAVIFLITLAQYRFLKVDVR